jgi:hypothetical protein
MIKKYNNKNSSNNNKKKAFMIKYNKICNNKFKKYQIINKVIKLT